MKAKNIGFGNLSIANKLKIGLGLIMAFVVLLIVTGAWSLRSINRGLSHIITVNNEKIGLAHAMQNATNVIDKSMMTSLMAKDETITADELKKMDASSMVFEQSLGRLEAFEKAAKGREIVKACRENFSIVKQAREGVKKLLASGDLSQAGNTALGVIQVSALLAQSCDDLVQYQAEQTKNAATKAGATYREAVLILVVVGALVVAFALFLGVFLKSSIAAPLSKAVAAAQQITAGDLTVQINSGVSDETGQLLDAMKNMTENLRHIIGEVKGAAEDMGSASQHLRDSSELMSSGAGEQAARASQVATASEEMTQTVLDIARSSAGIETSATETANLARHGAEIVDNSVEKVRMIARTVDESGRLIRLLGERSDQIGAILNVIDEIADQTNLLALNAAIEAARAGDAGRGFAVVADEVRKLAERTGSSTSEIGGMIRSIQEEVMKAVFSMEAITEEVRAGVELSTQAGLVLRNVVESVDQLHVMTQQIASATEEMTQTSDEISRDIESIASVSRETSGNSEQIKGASRQLSDLSTNLEKIVGGFAV
jgi:methyl-accepting chemotaxis protein